jgi:hypothetical protein
MADRSTTAAGLTDLVDHAVTEAHGEKATG